MMLQQTKDLEKALRDNINNLKDKVRIFEAREKQKEKINVKVINEKIAKHII